MMETERGERGLESRQKIKKLHPEEQKTDTCEGNGRTLAPPGLAEETASEWHPKGDERRRRRVLNPVKRLPKMQVK